MTTLLKRPVLRYHGGKWTSRKKIHAFMRGPHTVFCSWMSGAGSVELTKEKVHTEILNDRWSVVTNLFTVLRNSEQAKELKRLLELTPYSREEWNKVNSTDWQLISDPVELARVTIFRSFAGFGSASTNPGYSTGFRSSSSRSGSGPATDWKNYPKHIESFTERLQGVCIENKHYKSLCFQHDSESTLHYLDPPYVLGTRNTNGQAYAYEMSDADHVEMLDYARQMKGQVIISGYANELYDDLLQDWKRETFHAYADGAKDRQEVLWLNPYCVEMQPVKRTVIQTSIFQNH